MKYLPIFTVHFIGMEGKVPILCANFSTDPGDKFVEQVVVPVNIKYQITDNYR